MLTPKQNYLAAVRFESPDYVPRSNEGITHTFQFEGNFVRGNWTDGWGVTWQVDIEGTVPFPKGNPLPSLHKLADYAMPDPANLICTPQIMEGLAHINREEKLVVGNLTYLLFERAWAIMGMEAFLMALITHPAESHAFLHGIAMYARQVFDRYLELGIDAITFSEDLGTQRALFISPKMFRDFILPEYEYIFESVLREGKLIHFHSCGCIDAIAGDLAGIGVSILNPVQARANDLHKVKRDMVGRMALHGAIDTATLANGTPVDVRAEVERVMAILKPGGGYVIAPDQEIPGVPQENYDALWQTAEALGKY